MGLTFLLGGARSGKSALAVQLASSWHGPVSLIATAEARDEEMAERIRRHRDDRPSHWSTIEEPLDLEHAFERAPEHAFLILDCLSLWVANAMEAGADEHEIGERSRTLAEIGASRGAPVVCVSNEVGLGIVPDNDLARGYRDILGRANRIWAAAADTVLLVAAGRVLPLRDPATLGDAHG